jgi:rare lipoprotein A (peptidoglycan hydrolase)
VTSTSIGLRAAALAGATVLAIAIAVAVRHEDRKHGGLPQAAGQWYSALAAPYTPSSAAKKGACGIVIGPNTPGVAHPVLPCGVKIYVKFGGKQVLTQVVDRGHTVPGREFDVTQALAKVLGLQGTQTIQWRFAR